MLTQFLGVLKLDQHGRLPAGEICLPRDEDLERRWLPGAVREGLHQTVFAVSQEIALDEYQEKMRTVSAGVLAAVRHVHAKQVLAQQRSEDIRQRGELV